MIIWQLHNQVSSKTRIYKTHEKNTYFRSLNCQGEDVHQLVCTKFDTTRNKCDLLSVKVRSKEIESYDCNLFDWYSSFLCCLNFTRSFFIRRKMLTFPRSLCGLAFLSSALRQSTSNFIPWNSSQRS